jgi:Tfp pilus assembly protein PilN
MARRINLIPRSERPRTRTDWGLLAMVGLFIIVVFALGFGYYVFSNVLDQRQQDLADLKMQTAAVELQVAALQEYELLATQTDNVQAVVQDIYSSRTLLSGVLDAVSLVVPENAWFQNLAITATDPGVASDAANASARAGSASADAGDISIEGQTYSFEDVSRLIVRLQLIPSLADVTLTSADQAREASESQLEIKGFTIGASVLNNEPASALPLTDVEVQAQ